MVDASDDKEHYYAVAGDIITGVPDRLDAIDRILDRTCYALARMGDKALRDRLPVADRFLVDDAMEGRGVPWSANMAARRVARAWLVEADLTPQLGWPGGRCHVVQRIQENVRNPKVRDQLIAEVEMGLTIDNREANVIYDLETDRGAGVFRKLVMTPHSQYRMDQRGIVVNDIRAALMQWSDRWQKGRQLINQNVRKRKLVELQRDAQLWSRLMKRGEPLEFMSDFGLYLVFVHEGTSARLVTAYWKGLADPKPVGEGACQV